MSGKADSYDPYKVMHDFYKLDDPSEDEQFQFVEAMEYIINTSVFSDDIIAFSYNLAMYYRDIKNFQLEKKYLEMSFNNGSDVGKEQLGLIWYYGSCGENDYEKAFKLFSESRSRVGDYMISDMYHFGQYVKKDDIRCREILENLFESVSDEVKDDSFILSTLYPEIAVRLADLNIFDESDTEDDLEHLFLARDILSLRQMRRPFWGNIKTMKHILKTTSMMVNNFFGFIDLYDLLALDVKNAKVNFVCDDEEYNIDIFENDSETVYGFNDRWFHGAEDFLEKARINGRRITTLYTDISDIDIIF